MSESHRIEKLCMSSALYVGYTEDWKLDNPCSHAAQDYLPASNVPMYSALGASLSDLPPEVMTMIFEKFDSVARKKIERVCTQWQKIMQTVKKFRTHIRIESPALVGSTESMTYWRKAASYVINPDLEVFQLDGMDITSLSFDSEDPDSYIIFCYSALERIRSVLQENRINSSKVDIILNSCKTEYHLDGWSNVNRVGKVRIIRSEITAVWMGGLHIGTLFLEDLWLNVSDDDQMFKLFLQESGPMTKEQAHKLAEIRSSMLYDDGEVDLDETEKLVTVFENFVHFGVQVDWNDVVTTFALGRHLPKFLVELILLYFAEYCWLARS